MFGRRFVLLRVKVWMKYSTNVSRETFATFYAR